MVAGGIGFRPPYLHIRQTPMNIALPSMAAVGILTVMLMYRICSIGMPQARLDKKLRNHLSERQIDKMVEDSFPASDPPSTY